ncbi:MAG TPA: hypothetical protein VGN00_14060 [Puia sp.]|jgi:hypothetical protein
MATITIDDSKIRRLYKTAGQEFKELLEAEFGPKFFSGDITGRILSFEDACAEVGKDPHDRFFSEARPHENAIRKIEVWALALNEGNVLSYTDPSTEKWRVWVVYDESISGFRLCAVDYDGTGTYSGLGSRTAFASEKLARHFAKHAMPLINESLA